ncbi:MAG: DUF4198 domain-containing protein [Steroidobacteraceae bacterium]
MNKPLYFCAALLALLPLSAEAHKLWLMPSKTVLNTGEWVTFDVGASTQPFVKDHAAARLDNLQITAPDGTRVEAQNTATGRLRSTFDLQLTQAGTWRVALVSSGISASWSEAGQMKRWPQRGAPSTPEDFAKAVPANATDLKVSQMQNRVESFVTAGTPGGSAVKPLGKGLELTPVTGFNDLFAGEAATFQFLLDGKPAPDLKVELIADRAQYRNAMEEQALVTDARGQLQITWKTPGLYWLSASIQDQNGEAPAKERRASYTAILEVLAP